MHVDEPFHATHTLNLAGPTTGAWQQNNAGQGQRVRGDIGLVGACTHPHSRVLLVRMTVTTSAEQLVLMGCLTTLWLSI